MAKLFFALEAHAPWPETFPPGRVLDEEARHLTCAFLGEAPLEKALEVAQRLTPPFPIGPLAIADKPLFLPSKHPRTAGYHFELLGGSLQPFYSHLIHACQQAHLAPSHPDQPLLNHITLARHPEDLKAWKKALRPLPLFLKDLHLYESLGYSKYRSHYRLEVKLPFQEIPHTADVAFDIWGENLHQLYQNGAWALAFGFPPLCQYPLSRAPPKDLGEVIIALNELITQADTEMGCPFKAVSFHGKSVKRDNLLHWEMIVDV